MPMSIEIIGLFDRDQLYCAGSFTKFLTTFVCLSLLAEQYELDSILDDEDFLDTICVDQSAKKFLAVFQRIIGSRFTLRDLCTYYAGLPYTFDLSKDELEQVELGKPFKHHSIVDEEVFLHRCRTCITPVYANRCKFHYSEISIIFLGYLIEKIYDIKMECLYEKYVVNQFHLKSSVFSRKLVEGVYYQDLSDKYDYPAVAIADHGYFCYSNGYYTTLNDTKLMLEGLVTHPVFQCMTDIRHARAVSNAIMNGLAVEIRMQNDDILVGYEGLSFSGCNIWAYSLRRKQGYLSFTDDEDAAYPLIYNRFGGVNFDKAPLHAQHIYQHFIGDYRIEYEAKRLPEVYQGQYHRVDINDITLETIFFVGNHDVVIRNPEEVKYNVISLNNIYRIKCKDNVHGSAVQLMQSLSGHYYFFFDGNLYRKIGPVDGIAES